MQAPLKIAVVACHRMVTNLGVEHMEAHTLNEAEKAPQYVPHAYSSTDAIA